MNQIHLGKIYFYFIALFIGMCFLGCNSEKKLNKKIIGKSENEIIEIYGIPMRENIFILSDTLFEYQYNLLSIYPNYKEKNILIKEFFWNRKEKITVIWFELENEEWKVIDNLTWRNDRIKY